MDAATYVPVFAPWCGALLRLEPIASDASDVCWLNSVFVLNATTTPETWRNVAEALDVMMLIERLAPVDENRGVKRMWPTCATMWHLPRSDAPFEIGIVVDVSRLEMLAALTESVLDTERPRHQYTKAREDVVAHYARTAQANVSNSSRPRIPVRIVIHVQETETITKALLQILLLVASRNSVARLSLGAGRATSSAPDRALFEITDVEFHHRVVLNMKSLQYLDKLAQFGVVIHNIPCLDLPTNILQSSAESCEAFGLVETLHHLVAGIGSPFAGVQRLVVSSQSALEHLLPIMTSVQVSTCLRELWISPVQDASVAPGQVGKYLIDFWRCVAYTIFSPHAKHNVEHLKLDLRGFRAEYVDAIRAVLCAWRPVSSEELGAGIFERLLGGCSMYLTCSKVYLFEPKTTDHVTSPFNLPSPMDLRVIDQAKNDGDSSKVLLPGWGKAWALEPSVCANGGLPAAVQAQASHIRGFSKMSIEAFDEGSKAAASILMSLIGSPVKELGVKNAPTNSLDGWLAEVLPYFPRLQKLSIVDARITSLDVLIEVLASSKVVVTRLVLDCDIGSDPEVFTRFFDAIGDPGHLLFVQLGELHLKIRIQDATLAAVVTLSDALHVNRRLHTLRLQFHPVPTPNQRDAITRQLSLHVNAKPTCRVAALGAREKLAFLSFVSHARNDMRLTMQQVDTGILSSIFQFAAQGKERDVQITFLS